MTTEQKATRKLRAILSADVKGYSLLMTNDEASTIRTLKEYRKIISEIIQRHSGRVVDAPGDNMLAEFSSVVNAVQCSVEIQSKLKEKNADLQDDRRLEFRIGVNIGDVVQDGDSLYGEGVNIAARIEGLADPGGVCISRGAYDHIKNKLKLGYEYIGDHSVKNIKDPVRVYKVLMELKDAGKLIGEEPKPLLKPGTWATVIVAAIVLILIGYQVFQKLTSPEFEPALIENMAFTLPDEPSIAVLPFDNMSKDPEQEYFSDGITEQIITSLSNVPHLFVIARNSTFSYKNKPVKVQQIAEELGVQYILEGSVQRSGGQIRITAQLIDAISGHHLWAEKYDRKMIDIFKLQDEITMKIIAELQVEFSSTELGRLSSIKTESLSAYEKYLKGHKHLYSRSIKDTLEARRLAEEAIELDPGYSAAYILLARTYLDEIYMHRVESRDELLKKAEKMIQKSIELSGYDYNAHRALSGLYLLKKQPEKAVYEAQKAIEAIPNSADSYFMYGMVLNYLGRSDEAIPILIKAIRLNPVSPINYLNNLAFAYTYQHQYERAIPLWKETLKRNSDYYYAHLGLTVAYQLIGKDDKAKQAAVELMRVKPELSIFMLEKRAIQKDKKNKELILGSLRKAGIPEKSPLQLHDKPSIAVLPFANMSDDKDQEYLSDGITEDIITALSKMPKMFVIARNSTFTYKGKSVKVQEVGRDLGVRYVLEGSVRKIGDKVRITAQLIDAKTGHHLWAEKYDRNLENIFALQDEITKKIITELHVELDEGEQARIGSKGTDNLDAYLKTLQARYYSYLGSRESNTKAQQLAKEAIAIAPDYAYAHRILGVSHIMDFYLGMSESPKKSIKLAMDSYKKAVELDESLAIAYAGMGYVLVMMRKYDEAIRLGKKAFDLEPNSPEVIKTYASILTFDGRWKEAIPLFRLALRLNPNGYYRSFGHALRLSGQHEEAIALLRKAIEHEPNDLLAHLMLAVSASMGGFDKEAKAAAKELLRIDPQFSVKRLNAPFKDKIHMRNACAALNKAGLSLDCDALK